MSVRSSGYTRSPAKASYANYKYIILVCQDKSVGALKFWWIFSRS
jgi:hypothetical protein